MEKCFETKFKNSNKILKVTYNKDDSTLKFYIDDVLVEEYNIKERIEQKIDKQIEAYKFSKIRSGQLPEVNKVNLLRTYLHKFMYDGQEVYDDLSQYMFYFQEDIYKTIRQNDSFIDFLTQIIGC